MATSPGGRGGATVLKAAQAYFPFLGAKITDTFSLPSFYENFNNEEITDEHLKSDIQAKLNRFLAFVQKDEYSVHN